MCCCAPRLLPRRSLHAPASLPLSPAPHLQPCPPGNACPAGAVNPKQCSAGFFADQKQPFCRECGKGTYQNAPGQRACKPCPAGAYCPNTKTTAPVQCPAGTFNKNLGQAAAAACTKCPINVSGGGGRWEAAVLAACSLPQ